MFTFERLKPKHLELILKWRTLPHVQAGMITQVENNLEKHLEWFSKINRDEESKYWIINFNLVPIGVINLTRIDYLNSRCSAGFYIGNLDYRAGSAFVLPYLYNYVFYNLEFNKIYGEVLASNNPIIKIHKLHGFKVVGKYQQHKVKNESKLEILMIELTSNDWKQLRKYQKLISHFE